MAPFDTPARSPARHLSPRDLGTAIGVSESSIKRWVDDGELPSVRTRGGHRRIRVGEAMRWISQHGHTVVRPELLGLPDRLRTLERLPADDYAQVLARFLIHGQFDEARAALLHSFIGGIELTTLAREVLQPALAHVGEQWHHGSDGIAIEHAATLACLQALHEIQRLLPEPDGPIAMGGAPAGDPYQIPSLLAAMTLQSVGWRATNLGADVPLPALLACFDRLAPRLVWLSLSGSECDAATRSTIETLADHAARHDAFLIIGGRGSAALDAGSLHVDPERVIVDDSLERFRDRAAALAAAPPSNRPR